MIQDRIRTALESIAREEKILILYACESGSRAWGFPSQNSDYDVRFLYVHPTPWYLDLEGAINPASRRDVIERLPAQDLDLVGWDLWKALTLLGRSNPQLLEWIRSPIAYLAQPGVRSRLLDLFPDYYAPRPAFYHYLHMAEGNVRDYLRGERVWIKKYFYVLRPILACQWILAGRGHPPLNFGFLVEAMVTDPVLGRAIDDLLDRKHQGDELDRGPRIPVISAFIDSTLADLPKQGRTLPPPPPPPVAPLNSFFQWALAQGPLDV